jgi:hypothetical protein
MAFLDQVGDALGEDRSLARTGPGDDQHGSVDVLDGFALTLVRFEPAGDAAGSRNWFCDYHFAGAYQRWVRIFLRRLLLEFRKSHGGRRDGCGFSTQDSFP